MFSLGEETHEREGLEQSGRLAGFLHPAPVFFRSIFQGGPSKDGPLNHHTPLDGLRRPEAGLLHSGTVECQEERHAEEEATDLAKAEALAAQKLGRPVQRMRGDGGWSLLDELGC